MQISKTDVSRSSTHVSLRAITKMTWSYSESATALKEERGSKFVWIDVRLRRLTGGGSQRTDSSN